MTRLAATIAKSNNPLGWTGKLSARENNSKGLRTNPFGHKGIPQPDAKHYNDRLQPSDAKVMAAAVIARKPDQCHWPIGEGASFHFCDEKRIGTTPPYCVAHTEEAKGSRHGS